MYDMKCLFRPLVLLVHVVLGGVLKYGKSTTDGKKVGGERKKESTQGE